LHKIKRLKSFFKHFILCNRQRRPLHTRASSFPRSAAPTTKNAKGGFYEAAMQKKCRQAESHQHFQFSQQKTSFLSRLRARTPAPAEREIRKDFS